MNTATQLQIARQITMLATRHNNLACDVSEITTNIIKKLLGDKELTLEKPFMCSVFEHVQKVSVTSNQDGINKILLKDKDNKKVDFESLQMSVKILLTDTIYSQLTKK